MILFRFFEFKKRVKYFIIKPLAELTDKLE